MSGKRGRRGIFSNRRQYRVYTPLNAIFAIDSFAISHDLTTYPQNSSTIQHACLPLHGLYLARLYYIPLS